MLGARLVRTQSECEAFSRRQAMRMKKRRDNPVKSTQSVPRAGAGQLRWLGHVIPFQPWGEEMNTPVL